MLVAILQIAIPIEFSHTISTSNAAQMIESRFEVDVFVFESLEPVKKYWMKKVLDFRDGQWLPLKEQFLRKWIQFRIKCIDFFNFASLIRPQIVHRWTGNGGIVLFERDSKAKIKCFLEHILWDLWS